MLPTLQSEELRYERKFLITDYSVKDVEQLLKFNPACFSEIYHQRQVNNIYFDTIGFSNYYDNTEGEAHRSKVRIRWYDDLFGYIERPVLEFKIKNGLLGKKISYSLRPFTLNPQFSKKEIEDAVSVDHLPEKVKHLMVSMQPTLFNSYTRKYFLSADKVFRVTIDSHLNYYRIGYSGNTFLNKSHDHLTTVLEMKYDSSKEVEAKLVGSNFPFAMTKSSKYLQGIERVLF